MTQTPSEPSRTRSAVIALLGDDSALLVRLSAALERAGYDTSVRGTVRGDLPPLDAATDVVCVDIGVGEQGIALARRIAATDATVPVIALVSEHNGAIETYDQLPRAGSEARIVATVRRAAERRQLSESVRRMAREIAALRQQIEPARSALPYAALAAAGDADRIEGIDQVVPIRELERREILKALAFTNGSVATAARKLGIGRATLYRRLSELNLPPPTVALRGAMMGARKAASEEPS